MWCHQVLDQPQNHHVVGLTRWIKWWIYSPAVKKPLEARVPSSEHKQATKVLVCHLDNWLLPENSRFVLDVMPPDLASEIRTSKTDPRQRWSDEQNMVIGPNILGINSWVRGFRQPSLEAHSGDPLFDPPPVL